MIDIKRLESSDPLKILKADYLQQATAPLDGMWLDGFVPQATHYGFFSDDTLAGYCCVNDEGFLLQFHVSARLAHTSAELFSHIAHNQCDSMQTIKGAYTSTAEPQMLSYCADTYQAIAVNALMYQLNIAVAPQMVANSDIEIQRLGAEHLQDAIIFAQAATGADPLWLESYYRNLIARNELLGYWDNQTLAAAGECRLFVQHQTEYANLGVIVGVPYRGRGVAAEVLRQLVACAQAQNRKPICSTEKTNPGAQKAIEKAGFIASNRILEFSSLRSVQYTPDSGNTMV